MTESSRLRVPIKEGFFTVPDDPAEAPKFLCTKCQTCGEYFWPRRAICAKCLSEDTVSVECEGRGTLFSYTFVHMPLFGSTNLAHMDGYGVGQVDLPEGPRIQAPLAGKKDDFQIGQQLRAELDVMREEGSRDIVIFRFRPVENQA
ncbi:MAG TPA: OB-fold domain-containing protein [Terriglobales bacterium]|nr:OB-fold domain-containing protein [Terriglobales bacterium]